MQCIVYKPNKKIASTELPSYNRVTQSNTMGGIMIGRLRQQGGAIILTVPNTIATQMGWEAGHTLNIEKQGDQVVLSSVTRQPRGRKTVAQLLEGIDSGEVAALNTEMIEIEGEPKGNEVW